MNIELLRKVQELILEAPLRISMDDWFTMKHGYNLTAGCIAGWVVIIDKLERQDLPVTEINIRRVTENGLSNIEATAIKLLDLPFDDKSVLFHRIDWPQDLCKHLRKAEPGTSKYALVVSDAIDRFIDTNGLW